MKSDRTLLNIATLVDAVKFVRDKFGITPWWRGQACSTPWKLVPLIYRKKTTRDHEISLAAQFKLKAQTRHSACPPQEDDAGWLFLMQHYRLPTRLLDWSESPLIALYFAVRERMDKPGSLFVLDPMALNQNQIDEDAICSPTYYKAKPLFNAALANEAPNDPHILAVAANQVDSRMLAQAAQFTIHGVPIPLDCLDNSEKFLIQFEIPATAKQNLRDELFAIGIRESFIFPDLEHLTHELEERYGFDTLEDAC